MNCCNPLGISAIFLFLLTGLSGYLAGTSGNMTWLDRAKGTGNRQFYRLLIRQP